jgi:hypothetical protein
MVLSIIAYSLFASVARCSNALCHTPLLAQRLDRRWVFFQPSSRCTSARSSRAAVYLQIVERRRTGDQVRQQVIATLGRLDELTASDQLERLLRSGARFAARALVLEAAREEPALAVSVRGIGPGLVFKRLWTETRCQPRLPRRRRRPAAYRADPRRRLITTPSGVPRRQPSVDPHARSIT